MTVKVEVEALDGAIDFFRAAPEVAPKAASLAINQVITRGGMRMAQDAIMDQIAFPRDYLRGDRLEVAKYATESNLEGVIRGRKRATSLARFSQGSVIGKAGVRVEVKRGSATTLKNAWLVRLKQGASLTEDKYNVGLAVRLKPGEQLQNKKFEHQSWLVPGVVALLYGPSVDQIFRQVADDVAEPIAQMVTDEFFRQFDRLMP